MLCVSRVTCIRGATALKGSNESVTLWLSNVLNTNKGTVTRYHFTVPPLASQWVNGTSDTDTGTLGPATTILNNIATEPKPLNILLCII